MKREAFERLRETYENVSMPEKGVTEMKKKIEEGKRQARRRKNLLLTLKGAAAAAAVFIILPNTSAGVAYAMSSIPVVGRLVEAVTFRDYRYEDERHSADVEVPGLITENTAGIAETVESADGERQERLQKTAEEINQEIETITGQLIAEFEENLKMKEGYQDIVVKHEVIRSGDDYFTLKLICYQGAGSGAEWDYFYTIDLRTGERVALKDLFAEGADYITPISENIKSQMREQMAADENIMYWVDYEDVEEWNFRQITDETSFYINQDGNVVIAFNEGDVAPMYMGCVEFVIPGEILAGIIKM